MVYAAKRMGLKEKTRPKKKSRVHRRYPELKTPGEKVQIDVKEVPYSCLKGKVERSYRNDQRYFYDWETFRNVEEFNQKLEKHYTYL